MRPDRRVRVRPQTGRIRSPTFIVEEKRLFFWDHAHARVEDPVPTDYYIKNPVKDFCWWDLDGVVVVVCAVVDVSLDLLARSTCFFI